MTKKTGNKVCLFVFDWKGNSGISFRVSKTAVFKRNRVGYFFRSPVRFGG